MKIELLVFDWDGTLADSAASIVNAMQVAINELALMPRTDTDIRQIIGLGLMVVSYVIARKNNYGVREPFTFTRADHPAIDAWLDRVSATPGWKHPYELMRRGFTP